MNDLTPDERQMIENLRAGRSIICNVTLGLGVVVRDLPDGRFMVEVDPQPRPQARHDALKQVMRSTVKNWQSILARTT